MGPGYPPTPYGRPGMAGGYPAGQPGGYPGATPGVPGAMPGVPGGMPGGAMPGVPGGMPGGAMPGAMPGQPGVMPGAYPGMAAPGTKTCPNGHVMQAGWPRCPYCPQSAGPRKPMPKTRVADAPVVAAPAKKPPAPKGTKLIEVEEAAPVAGWLVCLNGKQKGLKFEIKQGRNTIGSSKECDICLEEDYISSRHANVNHIFKDGENIFILVDLDSANGTFLNDNSDPISKEELVDNDKVRFGSTDFRFKCI